MWRSSSLQCLLLFTLFFVLGCSAKEQTTLKGEKYIICANDENEKWSNYLYRHLHKRANDSTIVVYATEVDETKKANTVKNILIQVNNSLKEDYCIRHEGNILKLTLKDAETATWMVYQLIEAIAQVDHRFEASDLNPAIVDFVTQCKSFDFQYREPHYRSNVRVDQAGVNGNNNVELDWGIWGHNLSKALKNENDPSIYALVKGNRTEEQYCFSSVRLQQAIKTHIIDNFGYGSRDEQRYRFMIAPEDTEIVCDCVACEKRNLERGSASESVAYFINQLAAEFPYYQFFMLSYKTTSKIPEVTLASNTGVFISTINIPKGIDLASISESNIQVRQLITQVQQWQTKASLVYLWDYSSNFDDYLSPIPVLYALQKQLVFYKAIGVTGIFLNASEYEYSTFDELQYYVSSALMKDVHQSIAFLVKQYFDKFYPQSTSLLTSYYLQLEQNYRNKGIPYNMYGSTAEMLQTYLDEETFIQFYTQVEKIMQHTTGEEQRLLKQLFVGLTFTRMQIACYKGDKANGLIRREGDKVHFITESKQWELALEEVKNLGFIQYKEVGGNILEYLKQWRERSSQRTYENLLLDTPILLLSKTNEGFESSELLNNGLTGLPIDYHFGWHITSRDNLHVSFPTNHIQGKKKVVLQFLVDEKHRFQMPEYIEFWLDNHFVQLFSKHDFLVQHNSARCEVLIDFALSNTMEIKCIKADGERISIACDEIQITN